VIFVTGHGDVPMAVEAMRHGAFEFLQKPFREQDLIDSVQRAIARDSRNRAQLGEKEQIRAHLKTLTSREVEVLRLVVQGKANKVVAGDLGISQRTVEVHRANLMEKMRASSLAQLVKMMLTVEG
jgi:FixJ family two-component response regulator